MILKGSQRANGADLAIHLMNGFDNERIEVAEIYGAVAGDLMGAFAEFEVAAQGTKATDYLYSLSINPSAPLTREEYYEAIATIEHRLGLTDQPRAVIFHVKNGREHAHVVWSRIDIERMRAIHMAYDHRELMDLACELAHRFDFDLAPGLKAWEEQRKREKDKLEPSLAEKAQEQETGISPEQRREEITAVYEQSDSAEAFRAALEQKGYVLAKGDRRGLVVVDRFGNVHSLSRYVKGHTARQIKTKLAALKPENLPSVDEAKEMMRQRVQAQQESEQERRRDDVQEQTEERRRQLERRLAETQDARRLALRQAEQELLTRHQAERLALHAAQKSEGRGLLFRIRSAVADLIRRTPGLRSVLSRIGKLTHLDPKERHALENQALARRHARERKDIERHKRFLARIETRERNSLEKALRKEQRLEAAARLERERAADQLRAIENQAMQDFFDAARDLGLWRPREYKEGELSERFNEQAGIEPDEQESGDEDESIAPDRNIGADDGDDDDSGGPRHGWRRGKGRGYRRGS
jgi:hypothetical protein